ncbi:hypothetical protein [Cohnella terricola]|uniref:Uncharacterized protein n=1 Tax=Cohnella terricola TaxID=1289167 RepID=A0A559JCT6_9BACL|nr:hypothetical protein [Cohnella terricola]TVX97680.1 hypothetical protein FPZ45_18080 [Cohnella terricola]
MKKITFTVLGAICILFASITPVFAATVNESEPNNTFATANTFNLGDTLVGAISSGTDTDHFYVSIPTDKYLAYNINFKMSGGDSSVTYKVSVYKSTDTTTAVDSFTFTGGGPYSTRLVSMKTDASYYVKISSNDGTSSSTTKYNVYIYK